MKTPAPAPLRSRPPPPGSPTSHLCSTSAARLLAPHVVSACLCARSTSSPTCNSSPESEHPLGLLPSPKSKPIQGRCWRRLLCGPAWPPKEGGHISTSKAPPALCRPLGTDRGGEKPALSLGGAPGAPEHPGRQDGPGLARMGYPASALLNQSSRSHTGDLRQPPASLPLLGPSVTPTPGGS